MWLSSLQYRQEGGSGCFDEEGGGCIAGARIIRLAGVVHQKDASAGQDGSPRMSTGLHQIAFVEEIKDFRKQDQVELPQRPLLRYLHLLDADIGIWGAAGTCRCDGRRSEIQADDPVATG